jgi:hypothetical protein
MPIFAPERMGRGRGQILHRFRPLQTFDHKDNFVARVVALGSDDAYDGPDIDRGHLVEQAMRFVARWRDAGNSVDGTEPGSDRAPGFPETVLLAETQYEVVIPGRVLSRAWPLVVRCDLCRLVYESDDAQHGQQWPSRCPNNHQRATQLQYIFVHECGDSRPMAPPEQCRRCHNTQFELMTDVSRFMDFRWKCRSCLDLTPVVAICTNPQCKWTSKLMAPQLHTASGAYSPQGLTIVNVPGRAHAERRRSPEYAVGVLGLVVGACTQSEFDRLVGDTQRGAMPAAVRDALSALEAAGLQQQADDLRRRYGSIDVEALRQRVIDELGIDPLDPDQAARCQTLAGNLDLYQRVLGQRRITLEDLAGYESSEERKRIYASYPPILERGGFTTDGVFLVTNFPVTRLAVGYSRNGFGPTESDLVPYRGRSSRGAAEKTLLYAHPTETEALVFTLDQHRIEEWLVDNGIIERAVLDRAGGVRRWLARELDMGDAQMPRWGGESGPGSALYAREAVFTLLHTMAHQMLRALSVDSGFGEAALSEYLFPYDFAFAIYPNASSEFTIGGLRTVLEQVLGEVVATAMENDACLYDPNCHETAGADHGCLFLPETSCTGWNENLTRWSLFGGGEFRRGYWQPT